MPPNPSVNAEFRQHLNAEQAASVDAAVAAGRAPEDTKNLAMRNIIQSTDDPAQALQNLADGSTALEASWNGLEAIRVAGGLSTTQQAEYDRLERQIKGNRQLEAAIPTAYQRQHAEELIGYQTMEMPELAGTVNNLRGREQQAIAARTAARRVAGAAYAADADYISANQAAQAAHTRLQEAENVFNQRDQPNREAQAARQRTEAQQAAALRQAERQAEDARVQAQRVELDLHDVRWLRNEQTRLGAQMTELTTRRADRVTAGAGADELAEIDRDFSRAQERNTEAGRVLSNKLTAATEDINADPTLASETSFATRATNAQLRTEVRVRENTARDLRTNIDTYRTEYNNPATTPARRAQLEGLIYDATERLNREERVLNLYQETLSKSNKDFRDMNPTLRAEQLAKIGEELDMTLYDRDNINTMLLNNQDVTKEQLAAWTKLTITNLVQNGRAGVNMEQLNAILANRQELVIALGKGFENSRAARELLQREVPTNWRRMLDFASKHQGWLMILLAILAGTVGAAALAIGPMAGMAVAGGSAAAGGGAAYNYGRRG